MADIIKYGCRWTVPNSPDGLLKIEKACIKEGGQWKDGKGNSCGLGLYHHYREMMSILWPEDDHHRWSDLGLKRLAEEDIVVFMGSADSGKTWLKAKFVLCDWWSHVDNTLWMVSSTELRGAELRIWGAIKGLFNRARERFPWLEGAMLESKHCITTELMSEDGSEARLLTKGIIFIPCKTGNSWTGLGAFQGCKPPPGGRLGHAGDEVAVMQDSLLQAYSNWYGKANFKGILSGNPTDIEDPLCTAATPVGGWENWRDTEKTQEWRSSWYDAWVVAFDGRDSPNFDFPDFQPLPFKHAPYPYLIGKKKLDAVAKSLGLDSPLYWMQCVGKPRPSAQSMKVISRQLCEQNKAFEDVVWQGAPLTHIAALDAAYGGVGGDRCSLIRIAFGADLDGKTILCAYPPVLVPVSVKKSEPADKQIATYCMNYCEGFNIPPENFFFDGRSTLAIVLAQVWSAQVNVVDFGGVPTDRPVSLDEFVWDGDRRTRRLKLCKEHYSKFVTELWFSVYYVILSGQMRNLPRDVADEGCKRVWRYAKGNRIEVETKAEMKERTTYSPDLFDSLATAVEGARRRGFQISRLANPEDESSNKDWFYEMARAQKEARARHQLDYSA